MSKPSKTIVTKQRTVYTYAELWHASECLLAMGIENPKGSMFQFLSSAILTAFALEAYLNHVGAATFKCWQQLDRLPPWSKMELLFEELGVAFPAGTNARPLQTVAKLLRFRNTMAHGRSHEIEAKPIMRTTENYLSAYYERLLTDWEDLVQTDTFAKRAREDVGDVLRRLHDARRDKKEPLFTFGTELYGATLVEGET
jgi:hypothetical protein